MVDIKPTFKIDLFDKLVLPIIMYGEEVWGFHNAFSIEKLHLKYCKMVLKVKSSTVSDIVHNELDRSCIYNCDICLFCETWSNENTDLNLEGYECEPAH